MMSPNQIPENRSPSRPATIRSVICSSELIFDAFLFIVERNSSIWTTSFSSIFHIASSNGGSQFLELIEIAQFQFALCVRVFSLFLLVTEVLMHRTSYILHVGEHTSWLRFGT